MSKSPIVKSRPQKDLIATTEKPTIITDTTNYGHLTFPQAMHAIVDGHYVTRIEWDDEDIYCRLKNERLTIHNEKGFHNWLVSEEDMKSEDWIIIT